MPIITFAGEVSGSYYETIKKEPKAILVKLSNRVHTCTFLANASIEQIIAYTRENREYMTPMCKYAILHYPEYANQIEIMQSHILSISNVLETVVKRQQKG